MQMGRSFPFAAWQPVTIKGTRAHVLGGWYGHVLVADFIGSDTTCALQVKELGSDNKHVTAYAGYSNGTLAKVVLLNQQLWLQTSNTTRPCETVNLALPGLSGQNVTVKKLTGPSGGALRNITYAGLDWPLRTKGIEVLVKNDTETMQVEDESLSLDIEATQALLLSW